MYNGTDKQPIQDMMVNVPKGTSIDILGKEVPTKVTIGETTYNIGNNHGEYQWKIIRDNKFTNDEFNSTTVVPEELNVGLVMNGYEIIPIPNVNAKPVTITQGKPKPTVEQYKEKIKEEGKGDLPEGTKVEILDDSNVDTNKPGEYKVNIKIVFKDGASRIIEQKVEVTKKESSGGSSSTTDGSSSTTDGSSSTTGGSSSTTGGSSSTTGGSSSTTGGSNSTTGGSSSTTGGSSSTTGGSSSTTSGSSSTTGGSSSTTGGNSVKPNTNNSKSEQSKSVKYKKAIDKKKLESVKREKEIPKTGIDTNSAVVASATGLGAMLLALIGVKRKKENN